MRSYIVLVMLVACLAFRHMVAQAKSVTSLSRGNRVQHISSKKLHALQIAEPEVVAQEPVTTPNTAAVDRLKGISCILGGAMAHLTLGTLYCWGNFMSYAPESLRFLDGKAHAGPPDALYVMPLTLVAQAIAMPFGPAIAKHLGNAGTLLLGSWITALAVFLASYQTRLLPFIGLYSLMFGTGVGLAYTAPMAAGWKWIPQAKGLVSGGILAGFGAGGFIFSLIGSRLVNPNGANPINGKFPPSVYAAFPKMLRVLAALYAMFSLVGALLVTDKRDVVATSPAKPNASNNKLSTSSSSTPAAAWGLTVGESLQTYQFWLMWIMIISSATAGLNTASIYKQFAATSNALVGDEYQALVGGVGALFNGVGRLFWGSISDVIGFKNSFTLLTLLQMTLMLTYKYSSATKVGFAANTCMLFFCLAGNLALMPPATQRIFGPKAGTVIYGVIYSAFAIASVVGGMLTKSLAVSVGYSTLFRVMAAMSIVATCLVQFLGPLQSQPASVV